MEFLTVSELATLMNCHVSTIAGWVFQQHLDPLDKTGFRSGWVNRDRIIAQATERNKVPKRGTGQKVSCE